MEYRQFLAEILPRLETARRLERDLDRKLAHRFTVMDYLRNDELGLSRLIADFLDPLGKHGQETLFLDAYLKLVRAGHALNWPDTDDCHVAVERERSTDEGRSIDISVELFPRHGQPYCLAIENKPYAADQKNQVRDYLVFLNRKYEGRFLLIYLSPTGESPSEWSIGQGERNAWKNHLAIMPYYRVDLGDNSEVKEFPIIRSLANWFQECRKNCEVDRLRWFLRDAENFCKQTFGGMTMWNDSETIKEIGKFIMSRSDTMETAAAVHHAWREVKDHVGKEFLARLCQRIEEEVKSDVIFPEDVVVDHHYGEGRRYNSCIWLYRKSWSENNIGKHVTRTSICLENQETGLVWLCVGVRSPVNRDLMEETDRIKHDELVMRLSEELDAGKSSVWWPWWKYLDGYERDWDSLVPDLWAECAESSKAKEDRVTTHIVGEFLELARRAIPIISDVESSSSDHS